MNEEEYIYGQYKKKINGSLKTFKLRDILYEYENKQALDSQESSISQNKFKKINYNILRHLIQQPIL